MTDDKIISNVENKVFPSSSTESNNQLEFWTTEYLIDKLFLRLAGAKKSVNNKGKEIHVRKYYRQARELLKWMPIARPSPPFIICISDLTPRLKSELEQLTATPETLGYVLTQTVGRIFENLDFERYHMSIAKNLRVGFEK